MEDENRREPPFLNDKPEPMDNAPCGARRAHNRPNKKRQRSLAAEMLASGKASQALHVDLCVEPSVPQAAASPGAFLPIDRDVAQVLHRCESEVATARVRIDNQRQRIERLENEAELRDEELHDREAQIVSLRRQIIELEAKAATVRVSDAKFRAAKRVFAKRYHPNNARSDGIEKLVRSAIFAEFWADLEEIEAGKDDL